MNIFCLFMCTKVQMILIFLSTDQLHLSHQCTTITYRPSRKCIYVYLYQKGIYMMIDDDGYYYGGGYGGPWYWASYWWVYIYSLHMIGSRQYSVSYFSDKPLWYVWPLCYYPNDLTWVFYIFVGRLAPKLLEELVQKDI